MEKFLVNLIKSIISVLSICVILVFGFAFYEEYKNLNETVEIANADPEIDEIEFEEDYGDDEEDTISRDVQTPQVVESALDRIIESGTESEGERNDYNEVTVDKQFYNQLEEYSKIIYRAFESNKENMKTGTFKIEFGNAFSDVLEEENGDKELGKYYQSAIEAYIYDNADSFYISPNKMYLNIETITKRSGVTYNVFINHGQGANYLADEFSSKEQIEEAEKEIAQVKDRILANKTGNVKKDIKMVHDYLVDNIEYDVSLSKENIYNIYGALVNKVAVCEGYARAFKYLMDELEIPCTLVVGTATNSEGKTENHAWNYVFVDGKWLALDVTWDDPVIIGGGSLREEDKYKYYLIEKSRMEQDHRASGKFTEGGKVFNYPI